MQEDLIGYYNNYDEEGRLFRDHVHQVEWLTTIRYFEMLLPPASKILDGCAGTGNYAFWLAGKGHCVSAGDIVPHNVGLMRQKQAGEPHLQDIFVGDICDIRGYGEGYFDVVLCMGAFYHLDGEMREKAFSECLRVLKQGGLLVVSYINLAAAIHLQLKKGLENMDRIQMLYETGSLGDSFTYMTPENVENLARKNSLNIRCHLTSDGITYLHGAEVNAAGEEDFEKYMELHFQTCEDKYLLGYGLHGLVFLEK